MRIGIFCVADHHPGELPRTVDRLYGELLEQAVAADALGFDSFWIAEHHFHSYGVVPRPALLLAAAAARTRRIRLGAAVTVLAFDNPVRTAEDFAMLDILSGGRVEMGIGSGYLQHELAGFGILSSEKRERFDEALAVLRKLWSGQRVTHHSRYLHLHDVQLNVLPLQKPQPPIWIAGLRSESVPHIAAQGSPVLLIPYASCEGWEALHGIADSYRAAFSAPPEGEQAPRLGCGLHAHCAASMEQALLEAAEPIARYVRTRLYARQRSLAELQSQDLVAIGDGAHLRRLANRYAEAGVTDLLLLTGFGGFPQSQILASLETIAREVLPTLS
jgi:alkanesulfonate monooxygenase SsuD/methylene tetrahydromethanopterin reductase-like flavin-dependent oxidoreductase (luciferase family)